MRTILVMLVMLTAVGISADDGRLTDMGFLLAKINRIEERLDNLENTEVLVDEEPPQSLPVLEVRTSPNCGPCNLFKQEVAAIGQLPITVKYLTQSQWPVSRVPAFRYKTKAGVLLVRSGYRSGQIKTMIKEMTN